MKFLESDEVVDWKSSYFINSYIGNTPFVHLENNDTYSLRAKLESSNPTGSVKDRSASYVLEELLRRGIIDEDTNIIESSSGSFGASLSYCCALLGLKFTCVIDSNITRANEFYIKRLCHQLIKVTNADPEGAFLKTRLTKIQELLSTNPHTYWINQYENPIIVEAYRKTLAMEILENVDSIDYLFIGVSSGGTITALSQEVKSRFPKSKVIAVDIVGSTIFSDRYKPRNIPGIGSVIKPKILNDALIDEVVFVTEIEAVSACYRLLDEHLLHCGGSSGAVFAAIEQYARSKSIGRYKSVVTVFPDSGLKYMDTIYNDEWCLKHGIAPVGI